MNQFSVYLKGELRKLGNTIDAKTFLSKAPTDDLRALHIADTLDEVVKQFQSQDAVNTYVDKLTNHNLEHLTQICSQWRNNGVYSKLKNYSSWREKPINISYIYVTQAEPRLASIFALDEGKLTTLTSPNSVLWAQAPYYNYSKGSFVEFSTLLALRYHNKKYKVFDGIHRAIQLAYNGEQSINLCYTEISLG